MLVHVPSFRGFRLLVSASVFMIGFGVSGCGSLTPLRSETPTGSAAPSDAAFSLVITNLDGPPIDVLVNGKVVAHVVCDWQSDDTSVELKPGPSSQLPWQVQLVTASGESLGTLTEDGLAGPRVLIVRGTGVTEVPAGTPGGPAPFASCAP